MNFLEYSAFDLHIHVLNPEYDFSIKHRFYTKKKPKKTCVGRAAFLFKSRWLKLNQQQQQKKKTKMNGKL